ncbi:MAG: hypothetical protein RRY55_04550 [Bacteroidales bacterium]
MKQPLSARISSLPPYVYWGAFVLFQLLFVFQGLDFSDEGYWMTFYSRIFVDPESVMSNFPSWLTGITGGALLNFFPTGGLLMMRLVGVASITIIALIATRILRPYLPLWAIRTGIIMAMLFVYKDITCFCNNRLSVIILLSALLLLFNGIAGERHKKWYIFLAASLMALNVFARFPNILDLLFIALIPYEAWLSGRQRRDWIRSIIYFFVAWCVTLVVVIALIWVSGYIYVYRDSILMLFDISASDGNTHGLKRMFINVLRQYMGVVRVGGGALFVALLAIPLIRAIKGRWFYVVIVAVLLLLGFSFYEFSIIQLLYFISLSTSITIMLGRYHNSLKLLAAVSAMFNVIYPLGSDYGINIVGYHTFWLSFPFIIASAPSFFGSLPYYGNFIRWCGNRKIEFIGWGILLVFAIYFVERRYSVPYNDLGPRIEKLTPAGHPLLKGVYTTDERAQIIGDLLNRLSVEVTPGDFLIGYDNLPMLNYLTGTAPYCYNSWVLGYDSAMFSGYMEKIRNKSGKLPIVVTQHFQSIKDVYWEPDSGYFTEGGGEGRHSVMLRFLRDNGYVRSWSNGYFSIFKPCHER